MSVYDSVHIHPKAPPYTLVQDQEVVQLRAAATSNRGGWNILFLPTAP